MKIMPNGAEPLAIGVDPGAEGDHGEPVVVVEVLEHEGGGVLRLAELLALHAPGAVQDQDHVLGDDPVGVVGDAG